MAKRAKKRNEKGSRWVTKSAPAKTGALYCLLARSGVIIRGETYEENLEMERDLIYATKALTIAGLFEERVRRTPEAPAYGEISDSKEVRLYTWQEMVKIVGRLVRALEAENLPRQSSIGILLPNGTDWVAIDLAAHTLGLSVTPLHMRDHVQTYAHILEDAPIRILFIDTWERWNEIASHLPKEVYNRLQKVVITQTPLQKASVHKKVVSFGQWQDSSTAHKAQHDANHIPKKPERVATICYTSGTTGTPKGVVLTHRNILRNAEGSAWAVPLTQRDRLLSFLPLSHMFERTAGYYVPMVTGACVVFARGTEPEILREDFKIAQPTVLTSVPKIFERVHERVCEDLAQKPVFIQKLFEIMIDRGMRLHRKNMRNECTPSLCGTVALLRAVLFRKIRTALGSNVRFVVIGGAPLKPKVARFFIGGGIPLLQGYGLTENGPVVSVNRIDDNWLGSAGRPIQGTQVKLGADGELLVKSESVMTGYWKDLDATRKAVGSGGWLHTGDKAEIVKGRIYIKGRANEMIVLPNGENVWPQAIEDVIREEPLVENALVFLGEKGHLEALIVPNTENEHVDDEFPVRLFGDVKKRVADAFPPYIRLRDVAVLIGETWTVESGLVTPTLKLKRRAIMEKYKEKIKNNT